MEEYVTTIFIVVVVVVISFFPLHPTITLPLFGLHSDQPCLVVSFFLLFLFLLGSKTDLLQTVMQSTDPWQEK